MRSGIQRQIRGKKHTLNLQHFSAFCPRLVRLASRSVVVLLNIRGNCSCFRAKSGKVSGIYQSSNIHGNCGKLDECSDKLGPIVGNQGESSDRQATIRSQSGLSLTVDGNLYCSFLFKSSW
jgi:hypothetical protein